MGQTPKHHTLADELPSLDDVRRWWHKPHWQLLLGVVFVLVAVVAFQCFYPYGRTTWSAVVGDRPVGGLDYDQVIDSLHDTYQSVPLTVEIPGADAVQATSVAAGIVPDYKSAADAITSYSLGERLVPFSFVAKLLAQRQIDIQYQIEPELLDAFVQQIAAVCDQPPQDAAIVFEAGKAHLSPAANGQACDRDVVQSALSGIALRSNGVRTMLRPRAIAPAIDDASLQTQLASANAAIEQGVTIGTPAETWPVAADVLATWLTVDAQGVLQTKPEAIRAYLEQQRGKLYIEPGTTTVRIVDGVEVSRSGGTNGQGIDLDITEKRVSDVLLGRSDSRTAWAQLSVLPPREVVTREYSPSHQGLQALVEQWDREHSGRYGIIVRDLSGKGWNAEVLPDRDFVTASTYKMFLAYAVMHKIEQGELSMSSTTDIGLSVRDCIDEMILHSTNHCATALMNLADWGYVHQFIIGQFPSTQLDNGLTADGDKHTTVRDETTFMHRLYAGQLMSADHTNYLIGLFQRQVYRSGIPRGVPGVTVANKVGFYNGYKHDVGIIYAPSGTYILGILSYGGNDAQFADLSAKVYELMKQR